jgi:hypothetical protein
MLKSIDTNDGDFVPNDVQVKALNRVYRYLLSSSKQREKKTEPIAEDLGRDTAVGSGVGEQPNRGSHYLDSTTKISSADHDPTASKFWLPGIYKAGQQ